MAASAWTPVDDEQNSAWKPVEQSTVPPPTQPNALTRGTTSFAQAIGAPEKLSDFWEGPKYAIQHPIDSAKLLGGSMLHAQTDTAQRGLDEMKAAGFGNKIQGATDYLESGIPVIGPMLSKAGHQLTSGDIAGGIGTTAGIAAPIIAGQVSPENAGLIGGAPVRAGMRALGEVANKYAKPLMKLGTPVEDVGKLPRIVLPGENFGLPKKVVAPIAQPASVEPAWPAEYQNAPKTMSSTGGGGANYTADQLSALKAKHGIPEIPSGGGPGPETAARLAEPMPEPQYATVPPGHEAGAARLATPKFIPEPEPPPTPPVDMERLGSIGKELEWYRGQERRLGGLGQYTGPERRGTSTQPTMTPFGERQPVPSSVYADPQQAMRDQLERHGEAAQTEEARRRWYANSPETPKGVLSDRMKAVAPSLKSALRDVMGREVDPTDLTEILKQTLKGMKEYGPKKR